MIGISFEISLYSTIKAGVWLSSTAINEYDATQTGGQIIN
jgi:hypothetical protein